jgi:hypothetical protein
VAPVSDLGGLLDRLEAMLDAGDDLGGFAALGAAHLFAVSESPVTSAADRARIDRVLARVQAVTRPRG